MAKVVPGDRATGQTGQGQDRIESVGHPTNSTYYFNSRGREKEEAGGDGRSIPGRSDDGRLRRAFRRRSVRRRAGVARSRRVNHDNSEHESETESELSSVNDRASCSMNTQHPTHPKTAQERGINRTGPVDLAGKGRTCTSHRSLWLSPCGQQQVRGANSHAAQTDR